MSLPPQLRGIRQYDIRPARLPVFFSPTELKMLNVFQLFVHFAI
jgi:hypothetical protein